MLALAHVTSAASDITSTSDARERKGIAMADSEKTSASDAAAAPAAQGNQLTKEQIIKSKDLKSINVPVPEWTPEGQPTGFVIVKMLTGRERDAFENSLTRINPETGKKVDNVENLRARLIRMSVVNADGSLMFTQEDEAWLGDKSSAALDRIYTASAKHSKLSKEDVDQLLGNSKPTDSGAG